MRTPHLLALTALAAAAVGPGCSLVGDDRGVDAGDAVVLVVGDSVTELSRQELGRQMDWAKELIVRAKSGATTEELLPLARDGADHDPDIGVFLPGYNDVLDDQADTTALDDMVELAASLPCAVWLLLPTDGGYSPDQVDTWNARVEQAGDDHDSIHVVDDWKRLVEGSPDFTFLSERDAVHPNGDGQAAIAKVMSDRARELCT
ncbi:MAG TPA: SGNH/GDSL hydrolase family protein [Aquihabitans sp.]|nr:SGNH/GDSL hydrolase family protein [Aquihabitans sp.]